MYYSKYFEGSVEASTAATIYAPLYGREGSSSQIISSDAGKLKPSVVGNAIVTTLKECGLTGARYVEDNGYLYFDYENSDIGFYLCWYSTSLAVHVGYKDKNYGHDYIDGYNDTNGDRYDDVSVVFNNAGKLTASNYKFCVTVKGDTKSMFTIYLGTYNSPTALHILGTFYFGKDKRDDSDVLGCRYGYNPTITFMVLNAVTLLPCVFFNTTSGTPGTADVATRLSLVDNWIVLIEQYMPTLPFIAFDDIYIDPGFNVYGQFYEIDGEIYYCYTPFMIKCTTEVTPITEDNNG